MQPSPPFRPPSSALLERRSDIPLYRQLERHLAARMDRGEWRPGDLIPGEPELQSRFALSRTTVRQALRELELAGRVVRYRGRGTFVAEPKLSHGPDEQLRESLLSRGLRPGWRLLASGQVPAPAEVAAALGLAPGSPVFEVRRLRLADEEPIGWTAAWLTPQLAERLDPAALLEGGSMHYLAVLGLLEGSRAERTVEAVAADAERASWLGVEPGAPLLCVRRRLCAADGAPLESFRGCYRGDRFQYRLSGKAAG